MRLTPREVGAINAAARLTFGPESVVRLFGSSVDLGRRAADIDLHIETSTEVDFWRSKSEFLERLFARIDEQRVDHRDGPRHRSRGDRANRLPRWNSPVTALEDQALLREYLASLERISAGFVDAVERVATLLSMTAARIDVLPVTDDMTVIVFIKRFEQFEDALHRMLKAISKVMEHGKIERLISVDVTRRAFHIGILPDAKIWADAVRARNKLVHEYPINPAKRVEQFNEAWDNRETLTTTWAAIRRCIEVEGLLGDD